MKYQEYDVELLDNDTYKITKYRGDEKDVVVPSIINGKTVTIVDRGVFCQLRHMETITIPSTVKRIEGAFYCCSALKKIILNEGLEYFHGFLNCYRLEEINLPNSLTGIGELDYSNCRQVKYNTLDGVKYLGNSDNPYMCLVKSPFSSRDNDQSKYPERVEIPKECKIVYKDAFRYNERIKEIVFNNDVKTINLNLFLSLHLRKVVLPDSVEEVEDLNIDGCPALTLNTYDNAQYIGSINKPYLCLIKALNKEITECKIHKDCVSISKEAFKSCESLKSVYIPDGVRRICEYAFRGCKSLENVIIPNGVRIIDKGAFEWCPNLTKVELRNGIEKICKDAFYDCNIKVIKVPRTLTEIGNEAFGGKLCKITVDKNNPVYDSRENCNAIIDTKTNIIVVGCVKTKIVDSVVGIGEYAFAGNEKRGTIILPDNIKTIDESAYNRCSLKTISLSNKLTKISVGVFGASGLEKISIPAKISEIEDGAFSNCSDLKTVILNGKIRRLSRSAFYGSKNIQKIIINTDINKEIVDNIITIAITIDNPSLIRKDLLKKYFKNEKDSLMRRAKLYNAWKCERFFYALLK